MDLKWKLPVVIVSTLFIVGVYLSVHQTSEISRLTDPGYWGLMDDSVVQSRAQKSGEEKKYAAKQSGTAMTNKTELRKPTTISTAVFLNSSRRLLPWIDRKIFLPNYFTTNLTEEEKRVYKNSVIIYLHHNKAAGVTTKSCMSNVIPKSGKKLGPVLTSQNRMKVSRRTSRESYRNSYNAYMGGYSFGLCDDIQKPCSYFTVFRDPYHRSISSFTYCRGRSKRRDQLCRAQNPWNVTLKEWTIHQGSFLFRQLLFHPTFCSELNNNFKSSLGLFPHDIRGSAPCWFRQKVIMFDSLSRGQVNALVDFCVNNIENWFAVVGLTEEYDTSLAMMQQVYGVPFMSCAGSVKNTSGRYSNFTNVKNETVLDGQAQLVQDLMNDEEVERALHADVKLYNKIKEIFNKQKEKMNIKSRL